MHNPLFFILLPENSIADYPHNTLLLSIWEKQRGAESII